MALNMIIVESALNYEVGKNPICAVMMCAGFIDIGNLQIRLQIGIQNFKREK